MQTLLKTPVEGIAAVLGHDVRISAVVGEEAEDGRLVRPHGRPDQGRPSPSSHGVHVRTRAHKSIDPRHIAATGRIHQAGPF